MAEGATPPVRARVDSDFNGDGFADLAVTKRMNDPAVWELMLYEVVVLYGSPGGTATAGAQTWGSPAGSGNAFGTALATADLNGDGFSDLVATDAPRDGTGSAGGVTVTFGSSAGLTSVGRVAVPLVWDGLPASASTLAAGDFDGDGQDDVAAAVSTTSRRGVAILFGSASGVDSARTKWVASPGQQKGLAAGDFDGDGLDDLAIGHMNARVGVGLGTGTVTVLRGSLSGPTSAGQVVWSQGSPGVPGALERDQFGWSVAAGDLNGDGRADLAVGAPAEALGTPAASSAGSVTVLYGSATGITATGAQVWTESSRGVPGVAESGDRCGDVVEIGDVDGDHFQDLAIGCLFERATNRLTQRVARGAVLVLRGSSAGVTAHGAQMWTSESAGLPVAGAQWNWGAALALHDVDGDGAADAAVGTDDIKAGLTLIRGGTAGLTSAGSKRFASGQPGLPGWSTGQLGYDVG